MLHVLTIAVSVDHNDGVWQWLVYGPQDGEERRYRGAQVFCSEDRLRRVREACEVLLEAALNELDALELN